MLILFDIDATLISTGGLGIRAMELAGLRLYGRGFDSALVPYAGRLDPLIIADLLAANGIRADATQMAQMRAQYRIELEAILKDSASARTLPGVDALLSRLRSDHSPSVSLGLLTGNFPETGRLKLRSSGLDPDAFLHFAWGDDSPFDPPSRDHLPPIAVERFRRSMGRDPGRVVIVGDTPYDVSCALTHGHQCIAVATGRFSVDELIRAGATHALESLEDTDRVVELLCGVAQSPA